MIDLHTHSTASDGRTSPGDLMWEAKGAGISVLGLTDHDTVAGWAEAAARVEPTGVALVRGMEISAKVRGVSVHVLGYLFDPAAPAMARHRERMLDARLSRAREMVERIGRDFLLEWEAVAAVAEPGVPVGRPHIADALIDVGAVSSRDEAFARFLAPSSPYYVPHWAPQACDVVEWVADAGGRTVLAHPHAPSRGRTVSAADIGALAEAGLFGLEIGHRDNTDLDTLEKLAERHRLVRTGSSDYHGSGKPNRLGENTTAPEVLRALASGCFLEVIHS